MQLCGPAVPGLGTSTGRRRDLCLPLMPRGEKRVKNMIYEKKWKHPDMLEALDKNMSVVQQLANI